MKNLYLYHYLIKLIKLIKPIGVSLNIILLLWTVVYAQPQLNSSKWLIQHWDTDGIQVADLASYNANIPAYPASITKLLTAYTVLYAIQSSNNSVNQSVNRLKFNLETLIPISVLAASQDGSKVGYKSGDMIKVKDALQGMLAVSGNDAAWALAEYIGLGTVDSFVVQMNLHSKRLKLTQSNWINPHGLTDEYHISSASDLLRIAHALWYEFPLARPWLSLKTYTYGGITQNNHNTLLHIYAGVQGLKTGYTKRAGYNLATTLSLKCNADNEDYDWRLSIITLGAANAKARESDHITLINWAKDQFTPWKLYSKHEAIGSLTIPKTIQPLPVHTLDAIWVVLPKSILPTQLRYELIPNAHLSVPIKAGQSVARLNIYLNDPLNKLFKLLASKPVISTHAIDSASLWSRLIFKLSQQLSQWLN